MTHTIGDYSDEEVESEYKDEIEDFLIGYVNVHLIPDARMALMSLLKMVMNGAEEESYEDARSEPREPMYRE